MKIREAVLADARNIAYVHVITWQKTYHHILPKEMLSKLTYRNRENIWKKNILRTNNHVWVIENNEGQIIGFADTSKREKMAHKNTYNLTSIYILPNYHGRGWGKKLLHEIFKFYKEQQVEEVYVGVLKGNPAVHFYEHLGATKVKTVSIDFAGELIDEVIYRWDDVETVLKKVSVISES
ncbi:MAG: GNAT family N-acetyltransferase [Kurthia sp.]|nr:GNAT family N-acetyltransferase [Candidatus Kurthia equi]